MTAEQDGLDPAAVMDQHQPGSEEADSHESYCLNYECEMRDWPCLPYRLAALTLKLLAEVERLTRERDEAPHENFRLLNVTVQALWDVYAALGFDTDGDKTPAARVAGMGLEGFARSVIAAAAEHRRESEDDYAADTDRLKAERDAEKARADAAEAKVRAVEALVSNISHAEALYGCTPGCSGCLAAEVRAALADQPEQS